MLKIKNLMEDLSWRHILTLLLFVFVFFGCTQKQVVELKMPNKNPAPKVVKPAVPKDEDTVTVVEEFVPIDIKESDTTIKETTVPPVKLNSIDELPSTQNNENEYSAVEPEIVPKK